MLSETLEPCVRKQTASKDDERRARLTRKSPRTEVQIRAILYSRNTFQSSVISDLSVDGAGLYGAAGIAPGDAVTIKLLNGRELFGKVVWWLDGKCGVEFDRPLRENDPIFRSKQAKLHTLDV